MTLAGEYDAARLPRTTSWRRCCNIPSLLLADDEEGKGEDEDHGRQDNGGGTAGEVAHALIDCMMV